MRVKILTKDLDTWKYRRIQKWETENDFLVLYKVNGIIAISLDEIIRFNIIEESD